MSGKINEVWLDAVGRKIEVGDVLTHATRHGSHMEIHLCIVREFKLTSITVDKWGFWQKNFTRSYIRISSNATITGMTEEELLIHLGLGRKTEPLEDTETLSDPTPEAVIEVKAALKEFCEFTSSVPYKPVTLEPKGVVLWDDGTEQEAVFEGDEVRVLEKSEYTDQVLEYYRRTCLDVAGFYQDIDGSIVTE